MQIQRVQESDRTLRAATTWLVFLVSLAGLAAPVEADESDLRTTHRNGVGSGGSGWKPLDGATDGSGNAGHRWPYQVAQFREHAQPAWQPTPSMVAPSAIQFHLQTMCSVCLALSPVPTTLLSTPPQQPIPQPPAPPVPPLYFGQPFYEVPPPFTIRLTFAEPPGDRPLGKDAGSLRDNGVHADQCPPCPPGFTRAAADDSHTTSGSGGNVEGRSERNSSESSSTTDGDDFLVHMYDNVSSQQYHLWGPADDDDAQSDRLNSSTTTFATTTVNSPGGEGRELVVGESLEYDRLYRQREMDEIGGKNIRPFANDAHLWPTIVRPPSTSSGGRGPSSASHEASEEWRNQPSRHDDGIGSAGDRVIDASPSTRLTNGLLPSAQSLDGNQRPLYAEPSPAAAPEEVVDNRPFAAQQPTRIAEPPQQQRWRELDDGVERYNGRRQQKPYDNGPAYHYVYYNQPKATAVDLPTGVVRRAGPYVYYFQPSVFQYSEPQQQAFVYRQPFVPGFPQQYSRPPSPPTAAAAVVRRPAESTDDQQWRVGAPTAEPEPTDRLSNKAQIGGQEDQRWRIAIPPYLYYHYYGQQPPANAQRKPQWTTSVPISTNVTLTASPTIRIDEDKLKTNKKSPNLYNRNEEEEDGHEDDDTSARFR